MNRCVGLLVIGCWCAVVRCVLSFGGCCVLLAMCLLCVGCCMMFVVCFVVSLVLCCVLSVLRGLLLFLG